MNLLAGIYMEEGVWGNADIDAAIGGDEDVEETRQFANDTVDTGAPTGQTLFGMYNVLADGFNTLISTVTAGPTMLNQAGVPGSITGMLNILFGVVIVVDLLSYLRGWGL